LQSAIKLSEITSVVTTNALTIMGSKKVRCMIRLNNLRIMVTDSFLMGNDIETRSGVAGATKELLDRTRGIIPKGGGVMYAAIKVEDQPIGIIESTPLEEQHEDINQKTLLLRTIADVAAQAIQRATLYTKNIKSERLAAISKTAIAANHEINSPLTTILLKLDTLLRNGTIKPEILNALKEIKDEANKVRVVVKKMLEISDVVDTDYVKTEGKTEKMLDLNKAAQKPAPSKPAVQAQAPPSQAAKTPAADDVPGFEDYLDEGKATPLINPEQATAKPAAGPDKKDAPAPIDDKPGFEDYLDE
ncbi:MAG TPA: histidine kinase dimerization/phospho-acceptor domain-containing protein, partial [Deltaproteobacteria bacterium]|nr:histidine kinase dimerization/phospho-acceptor domain-containing protein [Deltaproteobacteria bacterium]